MLTSKRFDGDYTLVSATGTGTITLDSPEVTVQGNLTVDGDLTTVNSTVVEIEDNEITLNSGETGSEVTLGTAGIRIDRGTGTDALLLFEENTADGDIWVVDQGTGTNEKVVTVAIGTGVPLFNIVEDGSPQLGGDLDLNLNGITAPIHNNIPLTVTGSGNIVLTTTSLGEIILDGPVMIQGAAPNVTPAADEVALFKGADTGGGTQIHFENDTDTDELVSKSKAMAFALIF